MQKLNFFQMFDTFIIEMHIHFHKNRIINEEFQILTSFNNKYQEGMGKKYLFNRPISLKMKSQKLLISSNILPKFHCNILRVVSERERIFRRGTLHQ